MRYIFLLCIAAVLLPTVASAGNCYWVYDRTEYAYYTYYDAETGRLMGYMSPYNVYREVCWGPQDPPTPAPPETGPGIPAYIDPAWIYIAQVEDGQPSNVAVVASADQRLDNFALYYNGYPYGSAVGTGTVSISGVPASDMGVQGTFWVQGCASTMSLCASATATTSTVDEQKTEFGTAIGIWMEAGVNGTVGPRAESYPHSVTQTWTARTYDVSSSPGYSHYSFHDGISGFSYDYRYQTPVARIERLKWTAYPGTWWAQTCMMGEIGNSGDYVDNPGMDTSLQQCDVGGAIGGSGQFTGSIDQIGELTYSGISPAWFLSDNEVTVSVP